MSGVWQLTASDTDVYANMVNTFGLFGVGNGTYAWNVQCTDLNSLFSFSPVNKTFKVGRLVQNTVGVRFNASADGTSLVLSTQAGLSLDINSVENVSDAVISITYFNAPSTNVSLNVPDIGRYFTIEVSPELSESLSSVVIKAYYNESIVNASHILNESALSMYYFNVSLDVWQELNASLEWVYGVGVDTSNDFVWANVSHFSEYAVAQSQSVPCVMRSFYFGWNLFSLPVSV